MKAPSLVRRSARLMFVVAGILICAAALYAFFRGPERRYADWIRFSLAWRNGAHRIGSLPEYAEALFREFGILSPVLQTVRLRSGVTMLLDPLDYIDRHLIANGTWEETEWTWLEQALHPGDAFLDVGAHHGVYALRAALRVGPGGTVLAIEPDPGNAARMKRNIALNRIPNIRVVQAACGEKTAKMTLYSSGHRNTSMSSFSPETAGMAGADVGVVAEVPVEPLDKLAAGLGDVRIAAVKIDTEGAEALVLRGAAETLRKHRPVVLVETIPSQLVSMGSSLEELESLLASYGYRKDRATTANALWVPAN